MLADNGMDPGSILQCRLTAQHTELMSPGRGSFFEELEKSTKFPNSTVNQCSSSHRTSLASIRESSSDHRTPICLLRDQRRFWCLSPPQSLHARWWGCYGPWLPAVLPNSAQSLCCRPQWLLVLCTQWCISIDTIITFIISPSYLCTVWLTKT